MKKTFTFLCFCALSYIVQAQYHYIPFTDAKSNPKGLNTDSEGPFSAAAANGQCH